MVIYIFTAVISSWLVWLEEKIGNNKLKGLFLFLAVLIPAIVAGMRADIIGTDVRSYIEPLQYFANSSNKYSDFINYSGPLYNGEYLSRFEKGYVSLIYLCSRFDKSLFLTLFVCELIILGTLIGGLYKFNKKHHLSICLGLFIFLTLFYNLSFNLSRQCIAIFILFFGFNYLIDNSWIKYLITVIIAMLFHNSATIGVVFLVIYWFLYITKGKIKLKIQNIILSNNDLKVVFIALIGFIIIFTPSLVRSLFSSFSVLATYTNYIPETIDLSIRQLVVKLPFLAIILIEWKNMQNNPLRYFYLSIALIDIFLSQFSGQQSAIATVSDYGARISWYTSAFYIYSVPNALMSDTDRKRKSILVAGLVIFLIIYWYYFTVVLNYNETFPYVFSNSYFR